MPTPDEAVNDYNSNATADKWTEGVNRAVSDGSYEEGVADFLGVSPGSINQDASSNWQSGVQRQSAQDDYEQNTDGQAWLEGYQRSMQG